MLETRAVVISLDGKNALVEAIQGGGCGNCDSEKGCGTGKLSQLFCSEPRRFHVRNDANAQVGSLVRVAMAEGLLLRSALLMYLLPLALLLGGAITGMQIVHDEQSRDVYSAIGGLLGLLLGFVIVKRLSQRQSLSSIALPVILPASALNLPGTN